MKLSEIISELQKMENQDEDMNFVLIPVSKSPHGLLVMTNKDNEK